MTYNDSWTAEETEQLLDLADAKHKFHDIAKLMGRTQSAVRHKYKASGGISRQPKKQWTDDESKVAVSYFNSGFSYADIGRLLDRPSGSIRFHILGKYKHWNEVEEKRLLELTAEGKSCAEVAQILERSVRSVRSELSRHSATRIMSGKPRRPWTPDELRRAADMHNKGLSCSEIGIRLGRNASVVHKRLSLIVATEDELIAIREKSREAYRRSRDLERKQIAIDAGEAVKGLCWEQHEEERLTELYSNPKLPIINIAEELGRTPAAIICRGSELGIKRHRVGCFADDDGYSKIALEAMDEAFCNAMRQAIGKGLERAVEGIVKMPGTKSPIRMDLPTFCYRKGSWANDMADV